MADSDGHFAVALRAIDRRVLNDAFDACNREIQQDAYDRTALHRWLAGAVPARRNFIERLSRQLGRAEVLDAWLEARRESSSPDAKAVVTRFKGLNLEDKEEAFRQIREDFISGSLNIRSRFTMRVDLHDSDVHDAYNAVVSVNWDGLLPAKAKTAIVTDYERLDEAFRQADCIFRDIVQIDEDLLDEALEAEARSEQTLSYRPIDEDGKTTVYEAILIEHGQYEFPNDEVRNARVQLRVSYPFPRGAPLYPIVFRGYQIAGVARITLAIHSKRARNPRGLAFLGPGRSWESSRLGNELVIDAGSEGKYLGDETGIILHWSES